MRRPAWTAAPNLLPTLLLALLASPALANPTGTASVIDGDTVEIRGNRIRLHGIDAPESDQLCIREDGSRWRCGQRAAQALDALIAGRPLRCVTTTTDRYGRGVAECWVDGQSINRWMVLQGWAVAYREYSHQFVADEQSARQARRNMWSGTFDPPAAHRRARSAGAAKPPATPPRPACAIKGNVSSAGRIYHSPGQRDYDKTSIDLGAGERWFCSAREAEAAGWRPAQR